MPVTIDEITAEIEPSTPRAAPSPNREGRRPSPEAQRQRQEDLHALIQSRAQRLRAD